MVKGRDESVGGVLLVEFRDILNKLVGFGVGNAGFFVVDLGGEFGLVVDAVGEFLFVIFFLGGDDAGPARCKTLLDVVL